MAVRRPAFTPNLESENLVDLIQAIRSLLGTGSILFLGRPYSGKSRQTEILEILLKLQVLDSGKVLRAMKAQLPAEAVAVQEAGGLMPTEPFLDALIPLILELDREEGVILCSVGKKSGEESHVMKAAADGGHPIKAVVLIDVSRELALQRWGTDQNESSQRKELRADDAADKQGIRQDAFETETQPVIDFWEAQGLLVRINGDQDVQAVTDDIVNGLYKHLAQAA